MAITPIERLLACPMMGDMNLWGNIRNFFAGYFELMRDVKCEGCGESLSVCERECAEARAVDQQLMYDIK
jgi:hypothetical protein